MTRRDWDDEWGSGHWDFLKSDAERARLRVIARMVAAHAPGHLVDLGSGSGLLIPYLSPSLTPTCTCVDVAGEALARISRPGGPEVDKLAVDLNEYRPNPRPIAAIVCSEILYYLEDPAGVLNRWAAAAVGLRAVVVSIAEPGHRFAAWGTRVEEAWRQLDSLNWSIVDRTVIRHGAQRWSVIAYRPENLRE